MSSNPAVQRQLATRAKNKIMHPGNVVKAGVRNRRTTAEAEEEHKAKANLEALPLATLKPQGQVQPPPTRPATLR